jgi:hypothetical protein
MSAYEVTAGGFMDQVWTQLAATFRLLNLHENERKREKKLHSSDKWWTNISFPDRKVKKNLFHLITISIFHFLSRTCCKRLSWETLEIICLSWKKKLRTIMKFFFLFYLLRRINLILSVCLWKWNPLAAVFLFNLKSSSKFTCPSTRIE